MARIKATEPIGFTWGVLKAGYKWVYTRVDPKIGETANKEPVWVLTDGLATGQPYLKKQYDPLKAFPSLFRVFGGLDPENREAIQSFANQYGPLGLEQILPEYLVQDGTEQLWGVYGEPLRDWVKQIEAIKEAIRIWDLFLKSDSNELSHSLLWNGGQWVYHSNTDAPPGALTKRKMQVIEPVEGLGSFNERDILTPASFLAQRWINEQLKEHASPMLLYNPATATRVLQVVPNNLAGALWLQFARAIAGNKEHRACKECGKWFEISAERDGRTVRRVFCSDACKTRDYRRRKGGAGQSHTETKP